MSRTTDKSVNVTLGRWSFPSVTVGLILVLAGSHWLSGAGIVGWILIGVGAGPFVAVIGLLLGVLIAVLIAEAFDRREAKRRRRALDARRRAAR